MKQSPKDRLILAMLKAFDDLGGDRMAIVDARYWHKWFTKKCRKLGMKVPPSPYAKW